MIGRARQDSTFNICILSSSKKGHLTVYVGFTIDIKACCKAHVNLPMGQTLVEIGNFPDDKF
jgi:hypothetical protein